MTIHYKNHHMNPGEGRAVAQATQTTKSEIINRRMDEIAEGLLNIGVFVERHKKRLLGDHQLPEPSTDQSTKVPPYEPSFVNDCLLKLDTMGGYIRKINSDLAKIEEF